MILDKQGQEDEGLGKCRGYYYETRGYLYHAASIAENMFIGCYRGVIATSFVLFSGATYAHAGHGSAEPWHACEDKQLNDNCDYQLHKKLYRVAERL